ncbi:MAG TPA: response regulator [Aestuariivirga sp.]|nr:response regulator [Aestuariivirga sp.]
MPSESLSAVRQVLIVEDEPLLAMNLEDMLTQLGHVVTSTATRIDKALSLAEGSEFDLAFLDINLAGSNTFGVGAILRKRNIPFIFTSGYGAEGLIDGYRAAHLLTKPFGVKELERMIALALSEDQAAD